MRDGVPGLPLVPDLEVVVDREGVPGARDMDVEADRDAEPTPRPGVIDVDRLVVAVTPELGLVLCEGEADTTPPLATHPPALALSTNPWRHAVQAPDAEHAAQYRYAAVLVQHLAPPHRPEAHSVEEPQGPPAPWGTTHVPFTVTTCPVAQGAVAHAPVNLPAASRPVHAVQAGCTFAAQHTPPLHAPEAHWLLSVHTWPVCRMHAPDLRVVGSPVSGSVPHALHAPRAPHWVHAPEVPLAQHTPPAHTPLAHSSPPLHAAPAGVGATHTPRRETWVPAAHSPPLHKPSIS